MPGDNIKMTKTYFIYCDEEGLRFVIREGGRTGAGVVVVIA